MNFVSSNLKSLATKIGLLSPARKLYIDRYVSNFKKKYNKFIASNNLPLPDTLIWEPTGKCNLRCKFCYINFGFTSKAREMNFDEFKIMIEKMPFIKKIVMIGGELTLRRDLLEILDYTSKKNIYVNLGTNATLISERFVKVLAKYKKTISVVVSIDGPEEIHNRIRGWDQAFQRAINNIRLMREQGIFVAVVCVITKENLEHFSELVKVVKDSKANYLELEFERMYTPGIVEKSAAILGLENNVENFPLVTGGLEFPDYTLEALKISLDKLEQAAKKVGLTIGYMPFYFKEQLENYFYRTFKDKKHFCKQLFVPRIDCAGNVIFCFAIKKPFGNILKQSFEEIWYGHELTKFRKQFLNNKILPICNTCEKLIVFNK